MRFTERSPTRSIPYFNVLWAEKIEGNISIRYAQPKSKHNVRVQIIEYPLEKPDGADLAPWVEQLLERAYGQSQRKKRIKVLINPHGGQGYAPKLYSRDIEPIFAAARCEVDVQRTQYSGHGVEIAENLDIDVWDVVACCSGDGTPHEVFNGFGKRKDARKALRKVAVVQMPCGSGNAMSINLNGTSNCSMAALCTVKGVRRSLDLVSVTQGDKRTLSFLSQSVGIVAESDLGTEHLRWMGDFRFTWGFLWRLFGKTVYPCDIAIDIAQPDKASVRAAYKQGAQEAEAASPISASVPDDEDGPLPQLKFGTVNDPLPDKWEMVPHDTIGNFYAGQMAYMAADANFFPGALPSDGCMDMIRIDGLVPRRVAIKMLVAVGEGKLWEMDDVVYNKVNGYRIVPKNRKDGLIAIDGEKVPFQPYQAEVHRGLGTVLMKGPLYQAKGPGP